MAHTIALTGLLGLAALAVPALAAEAAAGAPKSIASMLDLAAALAVGLTGLGAGLAEAGIGSAAVGAIAENEKFFGKGLIFTVLPETIIIFGLVVAIILIGKI